MEANLTSLVKNRFSCRHFTGEALSDQQILNLLEAARWSPSSYGDQPWQFIVASKSNKEDFDKVLGCLLQGNQEWANKAGCLMIACAAKNYHRDGKPSKWGAGLALGQ